MARLKTLTYGRKKNDGDYGSFHLEVTVEVEESESGGEALKQARRFVHLGLGLKDPHPPKEEEE